MNGEDRKLLGRLEEKIGNISSDVSEIRLDMKEVLVKNQKLGTEIAVLHSGFKNHLKSHARTLKVVVAVVSVSSIFVNLLISSL